MKIDVITLQAVNNYGSVLQAFATQEVFRQHGCEARIINYARPDNVKGLKVWPSVIDSLKRNIIKLLFIPFVFMSAVKRVSTFERFRKKRLNMQSRQRETINDFTDYESDADAFCTGSDQVWNSHHNSGILPELYLSFAPEGSYKFAFSASFGKSDIDSEEVAATQKYIDDYKHISVREDEGLKILTDKYHYNRAIHVLDPTLCLDGNTWRKYAETTNGGGAFSKEPYILIYQINSPGETNRQFDRYAAELARRTGLRIVRICTGYRQRLKYLFSNETHVVLPQVFDLISLIDNARYVLTDSFHGTAFSLNLNTEPICILPDASIFPEFCGGRIASILRLTETLHRRIRSYDDFDVINRSVDFAHVNSVLDAERRKVSDWLQMVFAEIRERKS